MVTGAVNDNETVKLGHQIRAIAIKIIRNPSFDAVVLLVIATNAAFFAMADYSHVDSSGNLVSRGSIRNSIISASDPYFVGFFVTECVLKLIGLGVMKEGGYFRDFWNWLDFVVVVTGYVKQ